MTGAIGIANGLGSFRWFRSHGQRFPNRHCLCYLTHLFYHSGQIERRVRQRQLPIFPARDQQQLFYELRRAVELALHRGERLADLGFRAPVFGRPLHLRAQMGEGRAELVARVCREGLEGAMRPVDALEHAIDAVRELRHFSLSGGTHEPRPQLRGANRARFSRDSFEWLQCRVDRLTRGAGGRERGDRQQQDRGRHQYAEWNQIRLPARDDIEIELAHGAMQHAIAPAGALGDRGDQVAARALETPGRHSWRDVIDLRHAAGVRRGTRDEYLTTHANELVGQRRRHHTTRRAGRIAIGAEE